MVENCKFKVCCAMEQSDSTLESTLLNKIKSLGADCIFVNSKKIADAEIDESVEVLYIGYLSTNTFPIYLEKFPKIKWVQLFSTGVDSFTKHFQTMKEKNIFFTKSKDIFLNHLAEWVPGAILFFEKNLGKFKNLQAQKKWEFAPVQMLKEKTVGIVGFGDIGKQVAKVLKLGFSMKIIGLRNNKNKQDGAEYLEKLDNSEVDYLLENSDIIINILPKTKETDNYFDKEKFSKMKKNSIFINIGRGNSVNEDDLITFLKEETTLKGAALDVTKIEPLPQESELWDLENCLISNHSAIVIGETKYLQPISIEKFLSLLENEYCVDKVIKSSLIDLDSGY